MNTLKTVKATQVKKLMTQSDVQAAINLKGIWTHYKANHSNATGDPVTQAEIAAKMGWSQSNFSQYLNAIVPIGRKAAQTMANVFGCSATDIRSDYTDAHVIEENTQLKSLLHEVLEALSQLKTGKIDLNQFHQAAKSVENRAPDALLHTA